MKKIFLFLCLVGLLAAGSTPAAQLTLADVQAIIQQAVSRARQISTNAVIAVVDREGFVLGAWAVNGTNSPAATNSLADAITRAGTASFLSSDQHAFTSRTAGFIVLQNFPPGVDNKPPGPLVGVNFSNLPFSDINKYKGPGTVITNDSTPGLKVVSVPTSATGGLTGSPGGVPLFKDGQLVGGVGVADPRHDALEFTNLTVLNGASVDEDIALAGQIGYAPAEIYFGNHVFIDGISVPYVFSTTSLSTLLNFGAPFGSAPGVGAVIAPFFLTNSVGPLPYPRDNFGGSLCEIRQAIISDTNSALAPSLRLSASDVTNILSLAANRARTTRAGIRLPRGQAAQTFITVVNNPNTPGVAPRVLGTIRTPGATMFSWDVAIQKARTAIFYSSNTRAFSSRTVGFLAQSHYPPGIAGTPPGIFFAMQERFSGLGNGFVNPVNGAVVTNAPSIDPNLPNGITIFPGGFPLYRNGVLVGAIGVSGDGIDQDDIIASSGTANFLAPASIRGDQFFYRDARLPYAKFPRNPSL